MAGHQSDLHRRLRYDGGNDWWTVTKDNRQNDFGMSIHTLGPYGSISGNQRRAESRRMAIGLVKVSRLRKLGHSTSLVSRKFKLNPQYSTDILHPSEWLK